MIILRELKEKDASLMLEWMHDPDIQKSFKKNMMKTTIDDAVSFIKQSCVTNREKLYSGMSFHYAIANKTDDEYYGTISLKDLSLENRTAEYAIVLRKKAQGQGIAYQATKLLLYKAFFDIGLHRVFLNVFSNNTAAIKLYEKCGFVFEGEFREHFLINGEFVNWKWYGILRDEFKNIIHK